MHIHILKLVNRIKCGLNHSYRWAEYPKPKIRTRKPELEPEKPKYKFEFQPTVTELLRIILVSVCVLELHEQDNPKISFIPAHSYFQPSPPNILTLTLASSHTPSPHATPPAPLRFPGRSCNHVIYFHIKLIGYINISNFLYKLVKNEIV